MRERLYRLELWFLHCFHGYRILEANASLAESMCAREKSISAENVGLRDRIEALQGEIAELQEANQQITTEKILLEERLNSAYDDRQQLWNLVHDAQQGERYALQTQVNHAVQGHGGGIPYPDAHSLPPNTVRQQTGGAVGRRGRVLSSQAAFTQSRRFIAEELIPNLEKQARAAGIPVVGDPPVKP